MQKTKEKSGTSRFGLVVMLSLVTLAGCASPPPKEVASAASPPRPSFTVQTPIDQIAADKNGKEVLEQDVPGVMKNQHYVLFSCMSLAQVASLSGGQLTQAKLQQVNRDLAKVTPCAE